METALNSDRPLLFSLVPEGSLDSDVGESDLIFKKRNMTSCIKNDSKDSNDKVVFDSRFNLIHS